MILAGDVGATKILLEVGEVRSERWRSVLARRYLVADFPNIGAVLSAFLAEWNADKPARARITAGGIGVAGPAQGNRVKMTHRPWVVDGDAIAQRFGIPRVVVANDMAAAANGVDLLAPQDFLTLQAGKAAPGEPRVVLGVGTGLGVAYLVEGRVIPGEGGHVGFSPGSALQTGLWEALMAVHGRVEAEDVASGLGLANIYRSMTGRTAEPAWITSHAIDGDAECVAALDLFGECLGNVAGDHMLAVMARGGVFVAGGVIAKIAPLVKKEHFCAAFCAKGALSSLLMRVPVRAITNENLAVLGAARLAQRARVETV